MKMKMQDGVLEIPVTLEELVTTLTENKEPVTHEFVESLLTNEELLQNIMQKCGYWYDSGDSIFHKI